MLTLPPRIVAGRAFDLVVQVGLTPHAMEAEHFITWVELLLGEERAWVTDLSPSVAYPIVRLPVRVARSTTLTVRAHCNRHGVWRTRLPIDVRS